MRLRKAETMHTNELMKSCGEEDFDEDFGGLESGAMMRASKKSKLKRKKELIRGNKREEKGQTASRNKSRY
jgi:hypothetical protein